MTPIDNDKIIEVMATQTCSECGALPASRPKGIAGLSKREWVCDECGTVHNRDVNAATNILRVGQHTLAEGARPLETGSCHKADRDVLGESHG